MFIKKELLKTGIAEFITKKLDSFEIDENKIADTIAIRMLDEIRNVIASENYSDFEAIEEIVCIFEKYNVDCGFRHDF